MDRTPGRGGLTVSTARGRNIFLQTGQGGREHNLSATLLAQGRTLAESYFRLRAKDLLPLLSQLGSGPLDEQAKTVIRGYVHQAVTLPKAW